ncbi:MAG: TraB/GumN family protein, partial [Pseudomonadota bacterium]
MIAAICSTASSAAIGEPAVWTLSDSDTEITIIGTVHVLPPETNWRSARIDAAFQAADTVCFELDAVGRALEILSLSMKRGVLPPGEKLTDHLTEKEVQDMRALAGELGVPFDSLNVMQPWFAGLTVEQYLIARAGLEEGVEFILHPEVLESGKTLCELESVEEQMTALS